MKCLDCGGRVEATKISFWQCRCVACGRSVRGHGTRRGAIEGFYYKWQPDRMTPGQADEWRRGVIDGQTEVSSV